MSLILLYLLRIFDDLVKNLENNTDLYNTVYSVAIDNKSIQYNSDYHYSGEN